MKIVKALQQHLWVVGTGTLFAILVFSGISAGFAPGQAIGQNFLSFFWQMLQILPPVFILTGLFDVWIKTDTIEKHLGRGSSFLSYIWAILLAGTTVGGLHIALPVAHALHLKRAKLSVVLTFLSAAGIGRVPMMLFEASFLGWRFTAIRFAVSLPLVVLSCTVLGWWFERRRYHLPDVN
ncbi:MAG: permease [Phormidium sp.]|nr:MAG: putative permease [Phormidium sp. OSCR]